MPPIIRCDGKFDFLFYDIKAQLFPEDHAMSCQVEFSIRNLVDNTSSLRLTLLPTLEISRLIAQGDDLTYERNGHELTIHLKKALNEGDEQTFRIDYSGEMIANSGYDGYVGEEGVFMRSFAAWYPYCTGPECFHFPDVPYVLEACAPLGWTLFAHPDSPNVEQEADQVVYRWDGRQPHHRRGKWWGIALFGGKYHKIERKTGEHNITFFTLENSSINAEKIIKVIGELWSKLDEFSNMPSYPRQIRLAEHADFLSITYQPAHTNFFSSRSLDHPFSLTWRLVWSEIDEWLALAEINFKDDETGLSDLVYPLLQWFWAEDDRSPKGWLAADLEWLSRAYLRAIQEPQPTSSVSDTKGVWAWWMWRKMIGNEAFSRALHRLRTGAIPKDTAIRGKEFFSLTSDEISFPADWFWEQWMERTIAPQFSGGMNVEERPGGFVVDAVISQLGDLYHLPLDIVLHTEEEEIRQSIFMRERNHHLTFRCKGKPKELEIDPERKIMRLPYGNSIARTFKPINLGFRLAFVGCRQYGPGDKALSNGKRIVVVPTDLLDVAEALKPYLQTPGGPPMEKHSTEVEIYSPDEVTEELLENHNIVLIGNPKNNPLVEKMAISNFMRRPGLGYQAGLNNEIIPEGIKQEFRNAGVELSPNATILIKERDVEWKINDGGKRIYTISRGEDRLNIYFRSPEFQYGRIYAGDAIIEDERQALIAFGQHPKNDERFCLVVTALNNEALRNPPDFTEMPGDYLIYQDGKPIRVGFQRPYTWT
jgi:hypothetical protein